MKRAYADLAWYCYLTPKRVRNFGDNNGKKVDTQNVDLQKNVVFFMRAEF